jgi:hypothetical protein
VGGGLGRGEAIAVQALADRRQLSKDAGKSVDDGFWALRMWRHLTDGGRLTWSSMCRCWLIPNCYSDVEEYAMVDAT